jgi:hypothetical protein
MSPIRLTVSCKSPPPFRYALTHVPPFGHALIRVPHSKMYWLRCEEVHFVFCFTNDFTSLRHQICHSVKIFIDLESAHQVLSFETLHDMVFAISKIWPRGTPFLNLVLTINVIRDRPSKLIIWVPDQVLLSHQVWSWSNKKYSKNKVFISIMTWPNFYLDLWLCPYHLVWWLLTPWWSYMLTMMFLRWKKKKLQKFSFYVMPSPNDVITSKFLLICKALIKTFHMRYYTIWYLMVPSISKFDIGVSKFRPAARPRKVKADRPQKLISWVAADMLLSHQVWSWSDKTYSNKGFVDNLLLP